jgi:hypothetical protein
MHHPGAQLGCRRGTHSRNLELPSIVGMLLYLCTNRPDISHAISQVDRFGSNAKQAHAKVIKTVV